MSATLSSLRTAGRFIITAHRGASYENPENTLLSMEKAVEAGADLIEFDLRASREGVPVLLHDETVDRTSEGHGRPEELPLAELKRLNFSYFRHHGRLEKPCCERMEIPTFEEVLERFGGRVCMNIQTYARTDEVLTTICCLFEKYDMHDRGFLTVYPETAEKVRRIAPDIELCLTPGWKERTAPENLRLCRDWSCRFVQPVREFVTPATFQLCRELGLTSNVFFADDPALMRELAAMGADGVLTNRPEQLCPELIPE